MGFCIPIFYENELVGYSVTTAHHLDIGALTPGTCGIVDAQDAYAEGLQFNAIKVFEAGRRNDQIWRILADNIRVPRLVIGDMEAQIAAAKLGADRYIALLRRFGRDTVGAASAELMKFSEQALRNEIAALPDGRALAVRHVAALTDIGE